MELISCVPCGILKKVSENMEKRVQAYVTADGPTLSNLLMKICVYLCLLRM